LKHATKRASTRSGSWNKLNHQAFTLIELLVVMAVIGVLVALLMPAVQSSREAARRIHCQSQLKQLGVALHNYHDVHGLFPAGSYVIGPSFRTLSGWGWGAMILPQVEQTPLYQQINFDIGTAVGSNLSIIDRSVSLWRCPSDVAPVRMTIFPAFNPSVSIASGNYTGVEGILRELSAVRMGDITDGTSQTLLLGERIVQESVNGSLPHTAGWFGQIAFSSSYEYRSIPHESALRLYPINGSPGAPNYFSSRHTAGANFCFADGAVRFLSENLDGVVLESLGTRNGGETVGAY
jgi:prepilin-type N-terminal cleavage/methylation domain-containing protein/prepilin-type processing-associated H-X9-DG protein